MGAGMEIFHTPIGQSTWAAGVQHVEPFGRNPWQLLQEERGVWQLWHDGQQCLMTGHADPPVVEVEEVNETEPDLVRIERVMEFFIQRLQEDGVVIPSNVQRVAQ